MIILNYLNEEWRDIKDYEGKYQISNYGRVKSLNFRNSVGNVKLMNVHYNKKTGYLSVLLCKGSKGKRFTIHRLVATAFIPNPNKCRDVNHKDENKLNNFVWVNDNGTVDLEKSNLEWVSHKYNINYSGNIRIAISNSVKKRQRRVVKLAKDQTIISEYNSISEAALDNKLHLPNIIACCKGKTSNCGGFIWRYK